MSMGQIGTFITFSPSGEHGNAVLSPEEPASGVYWTLIGSGPDLDQNALAAEMVARLNVRPAEQDERAAFEAWYCADAALSGLDFWPADIAALRDGDEYGSQRVAINSKWEGWRGRAAANRTTTANSVGTEARKGGRSEQSTPPVKTGEG